MDILTEIQAEIGSGTLRLPRLSMGVMEIRRVLQDENASQAQVVQAVGRDASIAARVMMVANSAWYWSDAKISTLQAAVTRIGLSMVGNVVLGFAVKDSFKAGDVDSDAYLRAAWEGSVGTACAAAELAKFTRHLDKDVAFLAGLMSRIGALPVLSYRERHALAWTDIRPALSDSASLNGVVLASLGMPSEIQRGASMDASLVDLARVDYLDACLAGQALPTLGPEDIRGNLSARKLLADASALEDVRAKASRAWADIRPAFY